MKSFSNYPPKNSGSFYIEWNVFWLVYYIYKKCGNKKRLIKTVTNFSDVYLYLRRIHKMKSWNKILKELKDIVYIEVFQGVYICNKKDITEDQKNWNEFDTYKEYDFTTSNYWITSDNGMYPVGINNRIEYIDWYNYWIKSDSI